MLTFLLFVTLVLAAANGANDNIKGAATLLGSGLVRYRSAIALATIATALGGVVSIYLAHGLLVAFSGKGIVPDGTTTSLPFLLSVGLAAGATIWAATRLGLPVSTTHALLGGLVGAGFAAVPGAVHLDGALQSILMPLLLSPAVALVLSMGLIPLLRRARSRAATEAPCICVESTASIATDGSAAIAQPALTLGRAGDVACQPAPTRAVHAVDGVAWVDRLHFVSAAAVSFARGLNDTPKIAALMVAGGALGAGGSSLAVVLAMSIGGWLAASRVAETLGYRVSRMDASEGLAGNLVTSFLVIVASRFGMPVSTTHVSTGAIFGIALRNGSGHAAVIRNIVLAWVATLPLAALLAYGLRALLFS
ncbi:MAG: inorganic phosphate transporter [Proteobacteria bacterium]|nr:inorganic phosphate transporter [Pseudomonadota bacterium]